MRLGLCRLAMLVVLFVVAGGVGVLAQQGFEGSGQTIREIVVEGNQRIEDATVETYLTVGRGDPFDPDELDTSLRNLFATGLFDDVALVREGDRLIVQVVENPIINRIAFEGNRRIPDEELEAEVQLRPRVVYTRARVQSAVSRILELYRRNGRFAARVEPQVIELEQNRVDLVFEIEEGPLTKVSSISFIGNEAFSDATLRGVIETRERAFWRFLTSADTYDPDRLAFDEELLRRFYLERGYAEFAVVSSIAELTPDGESFFITFTLEEGPQYEVGRIDVDSSIVDLPVSELEPLVELSSGEVYNAQKVEDTIQAMTDRLGRLGYAFAEITPETSIDRDNLTIDVVFNVDEGRRVFVERIDIVGNVRTLDEVIRREMRLAEGDPYNVALLRRSRQRIQNLGYFESVEIDTSQGSTEDRIQIEVRVSERSTGELSFGAGFSTADGPLADVRLTERNLLGRGQRLNANFTISARTQQIDFGFTEPYFLDRELEAGIDLFHRETDFQTESSFDETSTGGTVRGSYPLTERLRHGVRYTLREDEIDDVDEDASVFIKDEQGSRVTSLIGQTLTYDVRDSRFLPSEGYVLRLQEDLAGLGGDNRFLRHEVGGDWYYAITPDVVFNLGGELGHIFGFGGEDVDLSNRFFLGGSNLRGFRAGGIGPRDEDTDDALGGNLFYTGTTEVRFPLGLPEELRFFGRVFADAGNLTNIDANGPTLVDSDTIRASVGVGVSWLSPVGPLSIDLSEAVLKESEDDLERFRISFGTRF